MPTIVYLLKAKREGGLNYNSFKIYITIMALEVVILLILILLPNQK